MNMVYILLTCTITIVNVNLTLKRIRSISISDVDQKGYQLLHLKPHMVVRTFPFLKWGNPKILFCPNNMTLTFSEMDGVSKSTPHATHVSFASVLTVNLTVWNPQIVWNSQLIHPLRRCHVVCISCCCLDIRNRFCVYDLWFYSTLIH